MARFADEVIERIKAEVSLVRLAESQGHTLTKHGKDLALCCPFHSDKTPSCIISPASNLPEGSTGKPHFQTDGKRGHTFWGILAAAAAFTADSLDSAASVAEIVDPTTYLLSNGGPGDTEYQPNEKKKEEKTGEDNKHHKPTGAGFYGTYVVCDGTFIVCH